MFQLPKEMVHDPDNLELWLKVRASTHSLVTYKVTSLRRSNLWIYFVTGWWWNKTEGFDKRYDLQGPIPRQLHKLYHDSFRRRCHLDWYLHTITFAFVICIPKTLRTKPKRIKQLPSNYRYTIRCWACQDRSEDNRRDHRSIWSSIWCREACKALDLSVFCFFSLSSVVIKASLVFSVSLQLREREIWKA